MRKIPTLFVRDPEDMRYLTREVHPDCQWVLDGEGTPTRKYDGTCVLFDAEANWWARREVKPGRDWPAGFMQADYDDVTDKTVGWMPIDADWQFFKMLHEALGSHSDLSKPGTYELCGPKINGNPEGFELHTLIRHAAAEELDPALPRDYDSVAAILTDLTWTYEGIVWHHPDGRMAKIKRRDFPRTREA